MITKENISNIEIIQKYNPNNMKNSSIKCRKRDKEEVKWVNPLKEDINKEVKN